MRKITYKKLGALMRAGSIMVLGLLLFKLIPMQIFGEDIRFDASAHITITMFCLYVVWFYVDQNKSWRTPFFVFALVVISASWYTRTVTSVSSAVFSFPSSLSYTHKRNIFGISLGSNFFIIPLELFVTVGNV
jgi:hypothetical protein